jgi:hypothetical protein
LPAPIPTQPPTVAAPEPQTTASAAPAAEITGSIPPVAIAPKPLTTPPATPVLSPAERLPAAFAGSLRAAAAKNDAAAEYEIGARYAGGRGVPQDAVAAAEWFERAAKQGLAPAQFRLGGMYEKGLGVKKNLETARRFYVAAGQTGNAKALHNLAVLYAEGIDGKPDYETAARWFRKAADYGIADSQYNLAILYARGIGVEQNLAEAYRWFALAARTGDAESVRKRDELGARLDRQVVERGRAGGAGLVPAQAARGRSRGQDSARRMGPGGRNAGGAGASQANDARVEARTCDCPHPAIEGAQSSRKLPVRSFRGAASGEPGIHNHRLCTVAIAVAPTAPPGLWIRTRLQVGDTDLQAPGMTHSQSSSSPVALPVGRHTENYQYTCRGPDGPS